MKSYKWYLRKFRRSYFDFVFGLANILFVGDKCPNCGASLKLNSVGGKEHTSYYCPKCALDVNTEKWVWTQDELLQIDGFSKNVHDAWTAEVTQYVKELSK